MGYVFHTPPSLSSSGTRSLLLYSADSGVDYAARGLSDGEKNDAAQNLWLVGGIPTSRPAFEAQGDALEGAFHLAKEFCGVTLLHIGTVLYSLKERTVSVLLSGLPDEKGIPIEFAGSLYLYYPKRIFLVDRTLAAKEIYANAPTYASGRLGDVTTGHFVSGFKPNLLAPAYVAVEFESQRSGGYKFPSDMNKKRHFDVYFEGKLVDPSEYTVESTRFYFNTLTQTEANSVRLCYYSNAISEDISEVLSGCTVGTAFGGGTLEGTRVFLAGNPAHPGVYYMSEIGDPLTFYEGSCGTLGESVGSITAFSKQSGDLLIFTESTVSRMSYHYSSGDGGYFSTKTIHASLGCDMPESVALAGNRTVFANSTGIYLVDSVELFDRMNLVSLSHNITDPEGKKGYLSHTAEQKKKARCAVFDRKYLLCVGNTAYVWDFGKADYSGSDPSKAEKRLVFTEFDGMETLRFLVSGETLAALTETETGCTLLMPQADGEVDFMLDSGGMDLGTAHVRKEVLSFAAECKCEHKTPLWLDFYADGQMYFRERVMAEPGKDGLARVYVTLPRYGLERFRFVISGKDAAVGLLNLRVDYRVLKKQH